VSIMVGKRQIYPAFNGLRTLFSIEIFLNHCAFLTLNVKTAEIYTKYLHN
jgi:hypothetical protein